MSLTLSGNGHESIDTWKLEYAKGYIFDFLNEPYIHHFGISFYGDDKIWLEDICEDRLNRLFGVLFFTHFKVVGEGFNAKILKDHPMLEARFYERNYYPIPEKFSFPRNDRKKLEEIIDYSYRIAKMREDLGYKEHPMYDRENYQRQREIANRMIEMIEVKIV